MSGNDIQKESHVIVNNQRRTQPPYGKGGRVP